LQAIQAVSLVTSDCSAPAPQGVAINPALNVAIVTEPGCNDVSMVSLSASSGFPLGTGFGATPELAVQSNPQGVDVYPPAGLAVVANAGSNSVSIVDMVNDDVATTFTADPVPDGVAVNLGTGNAVVTANGASVVDTFPVSTASQKPSTIGVRQSPSGVAIDPLRGVAVVANSAGGSASVLNLNSSSTTFTTGGIIFPQGVAFDPLADIFMITSGASNQVVLVNPVSNQTASIRVGIDPSSIAYNAVSSTLITANSLSGTVTMVDFLDQTVRAVFSLRSSSQFAVAIQPQTNLAVIADAADNELLLVPLPN
jgi:DNA-binding beta-propeller fold protein YncE